jgi:hypothetical protein
MQASELTQIKLVHITPSLLRVIVKQNNWTAGEIDTDERIFYSTPRSERNLFHLFGGPALGLNESLLLMTNYDIIKIKYCDRILVTTRLKWLSKGIVSPYCNQRVDKQITLRLSDVNLDAAKQFEIVELQQNLFSEVVL